MEITEISKKMKSQDNRATAAPYIICLQEKIERRVSDDESYDNVRYWDPENACTWNSMKDFEEAYKDYDPEDFMSVKERLIKYYTKDEWEDVNWFFTNEGVEQHLELNRHNYKRETRTYIKHMFRNPEMQAVWKHLTAE